MANDAPEVVFDAKAFAATTQLVSKTRWAPKQGVRGFTIKLASDKTGTLGVYSVDLNGVERQEIDDQPTSVGENFITQDGYLPNVRLKWTPSAQPGTVHAELYFF